MPAGIRDPDMPGDQIGDKLSCIPKVAGLNIFFFFDGLEGGVLGLSGERAAGNQRFQEISVSNEGHAERGGKGKENRQRSTSSLLMVRWT